MLRGADGSSVNQASDNTSQDAGLVFLKMSDLAAGVEGSRNVTVKILTFAFTTFSFPLHGGKEERKEDISKLEDDMHENE